MIVKRARAVLTLVPGGIRLRAMQSSITWKIGSLYVSLVATTLPGTTVASSSGFSGPKIISDSSVSLTAMSFDAVSTRRRNVPSSPAGAGNSTVSPDSSVYCVFMLASSPSIARTRRALWSQDDSPTARYTAPGPGLGQERMDLGRRCS
ncbi:hypothetical protein [Chondromyces apiculatus]|uniref:hypothetical protein n=1 Tax=Chondromyces apiculatus TaxID=51 RepID=UPI001E5CE4E0|nr:hypothetical protein [Chondromyces apiculatus]